MTRREAITEIEAKLDCLPDDRLLALANVLRLWSQPTTFSGLSPADRAALDDAVDSLDRGESIGLDAVDASLEFKLKAAGV